MSSIWTKAPGKETSQGLSPADYGWDKVDGKWSPIWYHGSSMPEKLNDWDSGEAEEGPGEDEEEEGPWSEDESADEE